MAKKAFLVGVILFFGVALASGQENKPSPPVSLAPSALQAKLINQALPEYPAAALENRIEGNVFVDVVVDETGKVQTARRRDCANCSSVLGDAAVEAIKQWTYQPTMVDGKPIVVSSWIGLHFQLQGGPSVQILKFVPPQRLRLSSGVALGNLVHKVDPKYPLEAKQAKVQGDVVLQCLIAKEGNVVNLTVISGDPMLAQAALEAVKQWKYKPYFLAGTPVEVETTITVKFHM